MATVTSLATHLLTLLSTTAGANHHGPQTVSKGDAARLALYHFLKNLCEPGEPLSTATFDRFFRRCLTHSHWLENKATLFSEVQACLQHYSNTTNEPIPLPPFSSSEELQVIRAESLQSLEKVVEKWVQAHHGPTDQVRLIKDTSRIGEEKILVCTIDTRRHLTVHAFDRQLAFRDGEIEPLFEDISVFYTANLDIETRHYSQIETSPHAVTRFHALPEGLQGVQVRGYTFQKVLSFEKRNLHQLPFLFYPLKRIEQFFINRATDPIYIELTGILEQATELMTQEHPERLRFAKAAFERGRLAYEHVFTGDRFLRILLENLSRALQLEKQDADLLEMNTNLPMPEILPIELEPQLGDSASFELNGNNLGLKLPHGQEFLEPEGPDLVELQEAELCETIAPKNLQALT